MADLSQIPTDQLLQMLSQHPDIGGAQPQQTQSPSFGDYIQGNPVIGAPFQSLLRAGQGIEQLMANGAASASDLGGLYPNAVSGALHGLAGHIGSAITAQNQGYEQARQNVANASTSPQVTSSAQSTGEVMGNLLNPIGSAAYLIPGIGPVMRGAIAGGAFGASQPVLDNQGTYWPQKALQTAGGAAAGAATGGAASVLAPKLAPANTTQSLKNAASDAYAQAEAQGVVIRQPSVQSAVQDITDTIQKRGIDPALQPKSSAVLARFQNDAANGGDMTLQNAETLRRIASSALDSPDKSDRALAHIIIDKWDDFVGGLKPQDVAGVTAELAQMFNLPQAGNAGQATDALAQARDLYARSAKSAMLERLQERAQNAVGANYSQAGYQTALRQQFRALANNDAAMRRFSPDEQAAILQVVRGAPAENALRYIGKLAIRGPMSALPAMGAFAAGGPEAAAGLEAAGEGAKWLSTQMALRNAENALNLVRNGQQLSPRAVAPSPQMAPNAFSGFLNLLLFQPQAQ